MHLAHMTLNSSARAIAVVLGAALALGEVSAQTIVGRFTLADSTTAVGNATVLVMNAQRAVVGRVAIDQSLRFRAQVPAIGRYSLHVLALGFTPETFGPILVSDVGSTTFDAVLARHGSLVQAQTARRLSGIVQDAASARPLVGAIVTISSSSENRSTRTDESGHFAFVGVSQGAIDFAVRRVGYRRFVESLNIDRDSILVVMLKPLSDLDTVRVRATRQGIYGIVATSKDFRPVAAATVKFFGGSVGEVTTDSLGRFFYDVKTVGAYLVRTNVRGLGSQSVSVTVTQKEAIEVALLIDSTDVAGANALEMAYGEFRERLLRHGLASTVVSRGELLADENSATIPALLRSRSFVSKGLRLTDVACVFVDGIPRPGLSANAIDPEEVEAVELYAATSERSGTLKDRWPKSEECADTGLPKGYQSRATNGRRQPVSEVVRWIVIWLKH